MAEDSGFGRLDRVPGNDPNRRALQSIDAVHSAEPGLLNEPVARLRRFVRIRRVLYYSILAPFGAVSRISAALVLASGAAAVIGSLVAIFADAHPAVTGLLMFWGLGALSYHALSVRLAALMADAAASVGVSPAEVLERWKR